MCYIYILCIYQTVYQNVNYLIYMAVFTKGHWLTLNPKPTKQKTPVE